MIKNILLMANLFIGSVFAETGYIEGEYRYLSAPQSGWITQSQVKQGKTLVIGAFAFALDDANQQLAVQRAENSVEQTQAHLRKAQAEQERAAAQVAQASALLNQAKAQEKQAQATVDNLLTGERAAKLQVYRKQKNEIQARLKLARSTLKRYQKLQHSKAVSSIDVDRAQANVNVLTAQLQKVEAELVSRSQPARKAVIASAKAGSTSAQSAVESANANLSATNAMLNAANSAIEVANAAVKSAQTALAQAQEALNERHIHSRMTGKITEVYRFAGEFVATGTPIAQVLADDNRKVIFFITEDKLTSVTLGDDVRVTGDGNANSLATITHIADNAEYTPPMLYSENNRGELVFRIEATLKTPLPIGLPVEVTL